MDEKTIILNYFMTQVVDGWMLNDLEALTSIPHRSGGSGNCNFHIALYTFACIEFLGYLTPAVPINTKQPGYTEKSVMGFIDDFFSDDFRQKLQPHRANFVNIFRNGLAHNYFAKAAGISRTKLEPFSIEDGHLVLDADRFAEAFKLAVDKLKNTIRSDQGLVKRMFDRYNAQAQANLKFKLSPDIAKLYSASTSRASLAHPSMLKNLKSVTTTSTSNSPRIDPSKTTTTLPPLLINQKTRIK